MNHDMTTEDGRIAAAQEAGYNVARHEALAGHTEPRNWDKDDVHNAGAFSHLAAAGFTRLGARMFSQVFVDAYRQGFTETRLEYLRSQLDAEQISTAELIELQGLAEHIDPGDVQLLEAAGVPEHDEFDSNDELPRLAPEATHERYTQLQAYARAFAYEHGWMVYEGISDDIQEWAVENHSTTLLDDDLDTIVGLLESAKLLL